MAELLVKVLFLACRQLPSSCVLMWQRERERALVSSSSFMDINPNTGAPPSNLIYTCPKAPPPKTIILEVRASPQNFQGGRHKLSVHNWQSELRRIGQADKTHESVGVRERYMEEKTARRGWEIVNGSCWTPCRGQQKIRPETLTVTVSGLCSGLWSSPNRKFSLWPHWISWGAVKKIISQPPAGDSNTTGSGWQPLLLFFKASPNDFNV